LAPTWGAGDGRRDPAGHSDGPPGGDRRGTDGAYRGNAGPKHHFIEAARLADPPDAQDRRSPVKAAIDTEQEKSQQDALKLQSILQRRNQALSSLDAVLTKASHITGNIR
jgi:hypothetical protein